MQNNNEKVSKRAIPVFPIATQSGLCMAHSDADKKKDRRSKSPVPSFRLLNYSYIGSLRSLFTLRYLILYILTLFKSLKSFHVQTGEMYEYILSVLSCNKAIAFLIVKPLYGSL